MKCLPMDTRRVALAGMKYFVLSSVLALVPCPFPFFLSYRSGYAYALTRWSLAECFFRVAVYICVCLWVFLRKDNT